MPKLKIDELSTFAQVILSDWKEFSTLVVKHTTLTEIATSTEIQEPHNLPAILSIKQIKNALEGPYQGFFRQKVAAYSKIVKFRIQLNLNKDENLRKSATQEEEEKIPESLLAKFTLSDLNNLQKELDTLMIEHNEEWATHKDQWSNNIIGQLDKSDISLSDLEEKIFMQTEPLSELLNRFIDLNLEPPKFKKSDFTFSDYLKLKTYLIIQSALSRQHKMHQAVDIKRILKSLKSNFEVIRKEHKALLNAQKKATDEVMKAIIL